MMFIAVPSSLSGTDIHHGDEGTLLRCPQTVSSVLLEELEGVYDVSRAHLLQRRWP
jgi:hypothetical protein